MDKPFLFGSLSMESLSEKRVSLNDPVIRSDETGNRVTHRSCGISYEPLNVPRTVYFL